VTGDADRGGAPALDLTRPRRLHIVGVGGVGMSAIALLLVRMGHEVSGSDV
jgi:UDP-N-acetylmuramate--alanine ligase